MKVEEFYDKVWRASHENASDLLREAQLLYENKFHARAAVLGIMSIEEQSKAIVCLYVSIGEIDSKDLNRKTRHGLFGHKITNLLRDHKLKQKFFIFAYEKTKLGRQAYAKWKAGQAIEPADFVQRLDGIPDARKLFKKMEKLRQEAIYVDVELGKQILTPNQRFSKEKTDEVLRYATEFLTLWRWAYVNPKEKWLPLLKDPSWILTAQSRAPP